LREFRCYVDGLFDEMNPAPDPQFCGELFDLPLRFASSTEPHVCF
jgi:hypothetical protein